MSNEEFFKVAKRENNIREVAKDALDICAKCALERHSDDLDGDYKKILEAAI